MYSQLPATRHFQPQLSPNRQCVAEILPGYMHTERQRVKIDCAQQFHNISIICTCESHAIGDVLSVNNYVNNTIYASIKYTEKNNSTLIIADNYCEEGWLHVNDVCYRVYPLAKDQCVTLNSTIISALNKPPWKYITQHFIPEIQNKEINLSLCSPNATAGLFMTVHGLYQCADFTYIAEHHVCDGDADCPDASDEMNCSDVCTFFAPQSNLSCYTLCTSDICACNRLYFQCTADGCISLSRFCDGIRDCQDRSDEILCLGELQASYQNPSDTHYRCISGYSIDIHRINDTVPDCPEHGDDEVWPSDSLPTMEVNNDNIMIACIPGHPKMFSPHLLCQLTLDAAGHLATCRNGAHLSDCIYHSCLHQYKCPCSYCIPVHAIYICDGRVDCPDGNDETDCNHTLVCPHLLKCKADGICVHKSDVNNGFINCPSYHDDEVTIGIKSCPDSCKCVGQAAYCEGNDLSSYIQQVGFVFELVAYV